MKKCLLVITGLFSILSYGRAQMAVGRAYDEISACTLFDQCVGYAYRHGNPSTTAMTNEIRTELMNTYGVASGDVITNTCGSCSVLIMLSFSYTIPGYSCTKQDYTYGFGNTYNEALDDALARKGNLSGAAASAPYQIDNVIYAGTSSVNEIQNDSDLIIYPNPAQTHINISNPEYKPIKNIEVYTLTGQLVMMLQGVSNSIDITTWSSGIYVLKIVYQNGHQTSRKINVNH